MQGSRRKLSKRIHPTHDAQTHRVAARAVVRTTGKDRECEGERRGSEVPGAICAAGREAGISGRARFRARGNPEKTSCEDGDGDCRKVARALVDILIGKRSSSW